jgi:hypothetical protein
MPNYRLTRHALNQMVHRGVSLGAWLCATLDGEWHDDGKRVKIVARNWCASRKRGKACDLVVVLNHQQTVCITVIRDHRRRARRWRCQR